MSLFKRNILVTGGAGFIGSHIVDRLLSDPRVGIVRVLDNFSTGFRKNLQHNITNANLELIEGDISNFNTCMEVVQDIDLISHQAALGSVPRSINDPLHTNLVNITGTLNIFNAARQSKVDRVVFAASSSTYGDSESLPKQEEIIGAPLSPYAVTKYVNELYADVFSKTYNNFNYIGLRYFNVFGPRQDPNGAYAAVIPLFYKAALEGNPPTINGKGDYSRDFTYVDNAVQANVLSLFANNHGSNNQIYNVACAEQTSILQLWRQICKITTDKEIEPHFGPTRNGDVPHSLASVEKANKLLGYYPAIKIKEGLEKTYNFYK